ncbi:MAG: hypothetical protein E7013_05165 [Alphaproteobacteria bacterium]|nr:hypothetical protein [Alphaproteobacteria bacterium]
MKKFLILFSLLLTACADVALTKGDKVNVMYTKNPDTQCEEVAVLATRCSDMSDCLEEFRSAAEDLNANTVKVVDWVEYSFGFNKMRMKGAALSCPNSN